MREISQLIQDNLSLFTGLFLLAVAGIIAWNIFLQLSLKKIRDKDRELFSSPDIKNLEDILENHSKNIKNLDKDIQELYNISNQINSLAFRGIHRVGIVRFNPFKDIGGDQSFSIALLNGKNNGLTLSSLYTREGTRIYSKSITNGDSDKHPLTEEEKEAIRIAMSQEPRKV